jgi:hypothetical protein
MTNIERQIAVARMKEQIAKIASRSWHVAAPVVIWDDEEPPANSDFREHVAWLEAQGVKPAVVHKSLPRDEDEDRMPF